MFIRIVKKKNDRVSIRAVENIRQDGKVKQKTVACIGHAHKDDIKNIEKFKKWGEDIIIKMKNEEHPTLPGFEYVHAPKKKTPKEQTDKVSPGNLREEKRLCQGVEDVFEEIYEQLNLFDSINTGYKKDESNKILKDLVLSRIHKPSSKRQSVADLSRDRGIDYHLDKVYRVMDLIEDNEDRIKSKVFNGTLSLFNQKIRVAFFDVTTLYFESFIPDDLRVSGYSKDNKTKETQVVLALMTTDGGLPLGYELFPGNTYEGGTLISAVEKLKNRYDVTDILIVADRAMFNKKNLDDLDNLGMKFVISAKIKAMSSEMKEKFFSDFEEAKKSKKFMIKDYDYKKKNEVKSENRTRRLIVEYNEKRSNKDKKDRDRLLERLKKKTVDNKVKLSDLIKNSGTKKYLKIEKKGAQYGSLDEDKITQCEKWDGLYGVITNQKKEDIKSEKILERYKGLWQIEEAFRVNKSDLKMRPIYHWTPKRIKAHILICYVAYHLATNVRYKLHQAKIKMSFRKIREELAYIQASIIVDKSTGKKFLLGSNPNGIQKKIYNALNLKPPVQFKWLDDVKNQVI